MDANEYAYELAKRCERGIKAIEMIIADGGIADSDVVRLVGKADGIRVVQGWVKSDLVGMFT
jgi:hypothetical protein